MIQILIMYLLCCYQNYQKNRMMQSRSIGSAPRWLPTRRRDMLRCIVRSSTRLDVSWNVYDHVHGLITWISSCAKCFIWCNSTFDRRALMCFEMFAIASMLKLCWMLYCWILFVIAVSNYTFISAYILQFYRLRILPFKKKHVPHHSDQFSKFLCHSTI